jgi:hypothetical protein
VIDCRLCMLLFSFNKKKQQRPAESHRKKGNSKKAERRRVAIFDTECISSRTDSSPFVPFRLVTLRKFAISIFELKNFAIDLIEIKVHLFIF